MKTILFALTVIMGFLLGLFPLAHVSPAQAKEKILQMYTWSAYIAPDVFQKFQKDTGIKVIADTYDSNDALLAKLKSGNAAYDIVFPSAMFVPILIQEGLIQPSDTSKMTHYKNLDPRFHGHAFDPNDTYSTPFTWGTTVYTVNTKAYKGPTDSWELFFNPPAEFKGKVGVLDDLGSTFGVVSIYTGTDFCATDTKSLKKWQDALIRQKPFVKSYSATGYVERLASGETTLQLVWSGDIWKARQANPDIKMVYPKEGFHLWTDTMAIPKGAKHPEYAREFINWTMDPKNTALISKHTGYANPNQFSKPFMDPTQVDAPEFNLPKDGKTFFVLSCPSSASVKKDLIWKRLLQQR